MVEFLLDTDHLIDMVNAKNGIQEYIEDAGPEKFAISEISLAEMSVLSAKTGLERYRLQIEFLEENFKLIPFAAHEEYGKIRAALEKKGVRLDDMDILIAATALTENLVLATGNARHFSRISKLKCQDLRRKD